MSEDPLKKLVRNFPENGPKLLLEHPLNVRDLLMPLGEKRAESRSGEENKELNDVIDRSIVEASHCKENTKMGRTMAQVVEERGMLIACDQRYYGNFESVLKRCRVKWKSLSPTPRAFAN